MRVIVLRPWSYYRAFAVVVILITNIPIEPVVQLDSQSCFRRLKTHRIRRDQRSRVSGRISNATPLAIIFVDSIGGKQRRPRSDPRHRFYEEEVVPYIVQAVANWVLDAVEEVIDYRFTINPMVVVAGAD